MSWPHRLTRLIVGFIAITLACPAVLVATISRRSAATTRYVAISNPSVGLGPGHRRPALLLDHQGRRSGGRRDTVDRRRRYRVRSSRRTLARSLAPITYRGAAGANVVVTGRGPGLQACGAELDHDPGLPVTGHDGLRHLPRSLRPASHITATACRSPGSRRAATRPHGIYVIGTTNSSLLNNVDRPQQRHRDLRDHRHSGIDVRGNTSFANARGYTRAATGIDVRSPGTRSGQPLVPERGLRHRALQRRPCSKVSNNLVYGNGDHGIDVLNSTDTVIVSNTVFDNVTAGINLEGATGRPPRRAGRCATTSASTTA